MPIDETHDPSLESWVESANDTETDFPVQNLPICTIHREIEDEEGEAIATTVGVLIGDQVLDLNQLGATDIAEDDGEDWAYLGIDVIMQEGIWPALRKRVQRLLLKDTPDLRDHPDRDLLVRPISETGFGLWPWVIQNYTDFYASKHHATNVGSMFRPDNPLLPNYKHIPVAYHGRASSVIPSGRPVHRPSGQLAPKEEGGTPTFGPCKMFDYELEMGIVIGRGNDLGSPIPIKQAHEHIFGLCLLNDWSARDIQKWEYQPLGPFLAKSFATSVSPYIVTLDALEPFRVKGPPRDEGDPGPLPHLTGTGDWALDITLEVYILTEQMRKRGMPPHKLSSGNFKDMFWTVDQMVAHHSSNGCNLLPGDLLGSGTVSGPDRSSRGCLLELTWDGDPFANPPIKATGAERTPITLPTDETRVFLQDGDEIILKGFCEREGYRRIGFGECRAKVLPAV